MKRALPLFVCAALAGLPLLGQAADKLREGSFGKPRANTPLLTPAQLRDCLGRQDRLRQQAAEMARQQATLTATKAELERLGAALKEQVATLDRTDAAAVAAYNAQVEARDKSIDAYQDGVPQYNAKVEALKVDEATFAAACANRRYDEAEETLIRQGK